MKKMFAMLLALCLLLALAGCVGSAMPTKNNENKPTNGSSQPVDQPTTPGSTPVGSTPAPTDPPMSATKILYLCTYNGVETISPDGSRYEQATQYIRDENGVLLQQVTLVNGEEQSRADAICDENGLVLEVRAADGISIRMTYDQQGRLLTQTQYNGELRMLHIEHTYDDNGNRLSMTRIAGFGGNETTQKQEYTYDENGKILTNTLYLNGTLTERRELLYSADGQPERTNIYDANGRLQYYVVYQIDGLVQTDVTLLPDGAVVSEVVTTYDAHGNILRQETPSTDGRTHIITYTYMAVEVPVDAPDRTI